MGVARLIQLILQPGAVPQLAICTLIRCWNRRTTRKSDTGSFPGTDGGKSCGKPAEVLGGRSKEQAHTIFAAQSLQAQRFAYFSARQTVPLWPSPHLHPPIQISNIPLIFISIAVSFGTQPLRSPSRGIIQTGETLLANLPANTRLR